MRRTLKLKADTPFPLESKLVHKFGYAVEKIVYESNVTKKYTIFTKRANPIIKDTIEPERLIEENLSEAQKYMLDERCDRIIGHFPDPYAFENAVHTRLHNMQQTLATAAERAYVQKFIDDNFPGTKDRKEK